jgi:hypothetical protein
MIHRIKSITQRELVDSMSIIAALSDECGYEVLMQKGGE